MNEEKDYCRHRRVMRKESSVCLVRGFTNEDSRR